MTGNHQLMSTVWNRTKRKPKKTRKATRNIGLSYNLLAAACKSLQTLVNVYVLDTGTVSRRICTRSLNTTHPSLNIHSQQINEAI